MSTLKPTFAFWDEVLKDIRCCVHSSQFDTWFAKTSCSEMATDTVTIEVPTSFYQEWLQFQYMPLLREKIAAHLGCVNPKIEFRVTPKNKEPEAKRDVLPSVQAVSLPSPAAGALAKLDAAPPSIASEVVRRPSNRPEGELQLNPEYTFSNFVVGPSNRLSHAASLAVVEDVGRVYNPLFIHGGLGLGKTHLLQAICHSLRVDRPGLRILYIPCEQFVNRFIAALEKGKGQIEAFRDRYRMLDVLLIDDIHFLANKDHTQEEFFHTFNSLYNEKKQIILSSDSAPKDIPTIEDRLVSRFKWGLVCEIESPTFEMRMAIIRKKAALHHVAIPDDVADFIASSMKRSIRELEGAVTSLIGYARLMDQPVSLETARVALADVLGTRRRRVTMDRIITAVTEHFDVRLADLQSKKRMQSIALPRQVCMYLARQLTHHSLAEIGGYFGGRDHSTVLYASEKVTSRLEEDNDLGQVIQDLIRRLEA